MNEGPVTVAEYSVKPKGNSAAIRRRCFFLLLNILLDSAVLMLGLGSNILLWIPGVPLVIAVWVITMKLAGTEYEYSIAGGQLSLAVLHGNFRRTLFSVPVKNLSAVLPDTEKYRPRLEAYAPETEYDARSAPDAPNLWFALFTDEDNRRCVLRFDATDRTLRAFRHYAPAVTAVPTVRKEDTAI